MAKDLSIFLAIAVVVLFAPNAKAAAAIFDVTKYDAKGSIKDVTQGFLSAWKDACAAKTPSVILIPKGIYLMNAVKVVGSQCKVPLEIRLIGTLQAPKNVADMHGADGWITINHVDRLTVTGGGTFDGQGQMAWDQNDCHKNKKCAQLPMNLRFNSVSNSIVQHVTSKDSKNFHINVMGCKNFTFDHFTISTPENSVNTDGIHLGRSKDVKIVNSDIKAGDDCISIGHGTEQLHVEKVTCGPGHGFSIGSLGRTIPEKNINGIYFKNCTMTGTQNGVRIKTWPSSPKGYSCLVSDVHFEDIIMNNVGSPVVIDQEYCPYNLCKKNEASLVQISKIYIKDIRGTASTPVAINLSCSKAKPCQDIELGDINIKYTGTKGKATTVISNVRPKLIGKQIPSVSL